MFYFHKRSADGSGKGNALNTGDPADVVRGVIFRVDPREKHVLDRAEGIGHGYVGMPITVADEVGDQYQTFMYVADEKSIDNSLRPCSWYKRLVVEGARQYGLPADYIARIEAMPATEDPDAEFSVL